MASKDANARCSSLEWSEQRAREDASGSFGAATGEFFYSTYAAREPKSAVGDLNSNDAEERRFKGHKRGRSPFSRSSRYSNIPATQLSRSEYRKGICIGRARQRRELGGAGTRPS